MRGPTLLSIGMFCLSLCAPSMANEQDYDQPDEFVSSAINQCEYWASMDNVPAEERIEYVDNCVTEELDSFEDYPLSVDLQESINAPAVWQ